MHYISCMLCSEHEETIVIALAFLHWQEFFEIFPRAVRTGMHFFHATVAYPEHGSTGTTASLHAGDPRRSATARNERRPCHHHV